MCCWTTRRRCGKGSTRSNGSPRTRRRCSRLAVEDAGDVASRRRTVRGRASRASGWHHDERERGGRWRRRGTSAGCAWVTDVLRGGVLSAAQVDTIAPAAAADPSAENRLVALARLDECESNCARSACAPPRQPTRIATRPSSSPRATLPAVLHRWWGRTEPDCAGAGGAGRADRSGAGTADRRTVRAGPRRRPP